MARITWAAVALVVVFMMVQGSQSTTAARLPAGASKSKLLQEMFGERLSWSSFAKGDDSDDPNRRRQEDERSFIAIKFVVPPNLHDEFIDEWKDLEDEVDKEKGVVVYDLKKTEIDNLYFFLYGEWESKADLVDHFTSDAFKDFKDWAEKNDVEWEVHPLRNVTDTRQERRGTEGGRPENRHKGRKGGKFEDEPAHILIRYHVPPSKQDDFEESWLDVAEDTWDEEDNRIYSLRKSVTSNTEYWGYGTWESFEAYHEHFHSKHLQEFKDDVADQGVVWFISPLEKFGRQKE